MSDPRIWGPDLWRSIHRITLFYPDQPSAEHKQAATEWFRALRYLLPCPACQLHYQEHFSKTFTPQVVESQENLKRWAYNLHNTVNKTLHKDVHVELSDLPRLYNAFPMRYVDVEDGTLLNKARYDPTGAIACPSDLQAQQALQKRIQALQEAARREEYESRSSTLRASDRAADESSPWALTGWATLTVAVASLLLLVGAITVTVSFVMAATSASSANRSEPVQAYLPLARRRPPRNPPIAFARNDDASNDQRDGDAFNGALLSDAASTDRDVIASTL